MSISFLNSTSDVHQILDGEISDSRLTRCAYKIQRNSEHPSFNSFVDCVELLHSNRSKPADEFRSDVLNREIHHLLLSHRRKSERNEVSRCPGREPAPCEIHEVTISHYSEIGYRQRAKRRNERSLRVKLELSCASSAREAPAEVESPCILVDSK